MFIHAAPQQSLSARPLRKGPRRMTTAAMHAPQPTDHRSSEILDFARRAFVEKGFDGASMQDLARAAGMSVGNFYRYFPSKAAIVAALVTRDLAEVEQEFGAIIGSAQPRDALRETLQRHISGEACGDDGPIWAEITAAAVRKPEIGAVLQRMEAEICGYLTIVFGLIAARPVAEAAVRYGAHCRLLMMLVKASAMRLPQADDAAGDLNDLLMRMIDRILDEIAQDAAKG